ncbi:MAG: hypothetical protein ACFFDT_16300 [Candidatus Hodarchaeota archaeon]
MKTKRQHCDDTKIYRKRIEIVARFSIKSSSISIKINQKTELQFMIHEEFNTPFIEKEEVKYK